MGNRCVAATQEDDENAVAIDGKTLCGSLTQDAQITHLLSVVTHQLGITLTQRPVSDKTNEIPIASRILEAFDVAGKVVTTEPKEALTLLGANFDN